MRWSEIADQNCSVARTLSVLGDRWTMLLIREAFLGTRRFEDFQGNTGCPRATLSDRLAGLVDDDVLEKRPYSDHPDRFEYRLTTKGIDLYPIVVSLLTWGDRWMQPDGAGPLKLRHTPCGEIVVPELRCPTCDEAIDPREMEPVGELRPGTGLRASGPKSA